MKSNLSPKRLITAASVTLAALFVPDQSQAAVLVTYEMRIDPVTSTPGTQFADIHTAIAQAPGAVIGLQIWAIVHGGNAIPTDDGFLQGHLSIISGTFTPNASPPVAPAPWGVSVGGTLIGTLRGDGTGVEGSPLVAASRTQTNNAPGFRGIVAQSGYMGNGTVLSLDTPHDASVDIGSFQSDGPTVLPWFIALSDNNTSPTLGTVLTGANTEFMIGTTTFTLSAAALPGQSTPINIVPRLRTGGGVNGPLVHKFRVDGTDFSLAGNNAQINEIGVNVGLATPEPGTALLFGIGCLGIAATRRRAGSR